jgi:hypothetical protein
VAYACRAGERREKADLTLSIMRAYRHAAQSDPLLPKHAKIAKRLDKIDLLLIPLFLVTPARAV